MPFNTICGFVKTEAFGVYGGIAGVFHRLRVNDNQPRPLGFFLT